MYSQGTTILEAELPTMPDNLFYTPERLSGVKAEYFAGFDMEEEPILVRTEKSPNISWEFDKTPDSILFEPNYFSVRFSGNLIFKKYSVFLWCNARKNAISFYKKNGFNEQGDFFLKEEMKR